jgi:hypothetical protein
MELRCSKPYSAMTMQHKKTVTTTPKFFQIIISHRCGILPAV